MALLVPAGQPVTAAVDDTLFRHPGESRHPGMAGHRDAAIDNKPATRILLAITRPGAVDGTIRRRRTPLDGQGSRPGKAP